MSSESNAVAVEFWEQIYARLADASDAAVLDPNYDERQDESRFRVALSEAGWSETEIDARVRLHHEQSNQAPVTSPGVSPGAEFILKRVCDSVEAAMKRLGLDSHTRVARGVEPRAGTTASMTNVIMTEQGIVTVSSFLFRFCGLIARAFTRTLLLDPWMWQHDSYSETRATDLLHASPVLSIYWTKIFLSFALTGTHVMVPFRPATKGEVLLFEQVARAMEIFAVAHEYGHHHLRHRQVHADAKLEEFDADQFALRISYEVERHPELFANPYLSSGAGGVLLLTALDMLTDFKGQVLASRPESRETHPLLEERLSRFDSVALMVPSEAKALRGFRVVSGRIMACVKTEVTENLRFMSADLRAHFQAHPG